MSNKTYYLVIYDEALSKGANYAMPSVLDKESAEVILQDALPTIDRKKNGRKYQVTQKRLFNYKQPDGTEVLFIVCDAVKIEKKKL